jgi:hypothetical protein
MQVLVRGSRRLSRGTLLRRQAGRGAARPRRKVSVWLWLAAAGIAFGGGFDAARAQTEGHRNHAAGVEARGDHAMGFDHRKTTHHFLLRQDGGVIEVTANDPADAASRDAIRMHLAHIAVMFSKGDFSAPMFIHDRVPPGVPAMKKRRTAIHYAFEDVPRGGRVRIRTTDPAAIAAVHEFLRFQIEDHHTGDSRKVTAPRD